MLMLNGKMFKIAAQPVMVLGLIIVPIMIDGEKELCIIEVVQNQVELIAIITPQPKMNLSKTAVQSLVEHGLHGIVMAI